jgi:hypothetical protein
MVNHTDFFKVSENVNIPKNDKTATTGTQEKVRQNGIKILIIFPISKPKVIRC